MAVKRLSKTRAAVALGDELQLFKPNCVGRAEQFENATSDEEAQALCEGCPILLACRNYGKSDPAASGVWGGKLFVDKFPDND